MKKRIEMSCSTNQQPKLTTVIIGLLILMLVNICLTAKAQSTVYTEDFERGSSAWQFVTNSGSGNNYWEINTGSCTNGSNKLMVRRNTDPCVYRTNQAHNITARTQVDARNFKDLTLAFDWICNGQANADYGSVYYSYNGTTWTMLTTGGNNGVYQGVTTWQNQAAFALPSALNDTVFYLGFNWVNNNSGGSYPGFGFDNIEVKGTVIPATPPAGITGTIFTEDFSDGTLPTGWSNTDNTGNSAGTWSFNNPGNRTINTTTRANGFAIFDSDHIGQDNKWENASLVSPAINCSNYAIVTLQLEQYFRYYLPSNYTISISGNNGASYTVLELDSATTANAETLNFDVSGIAAGKGQVRLKFTYQGSWGYYWAIDDIVMEGQLADSAVWTGAVSTAWNTAGNWSINQVPTTSTSVLIPANAQRMPTIASNVGAGANNLTIQSGATLTVASDSLQGGNLSLSGSLFCNGTITKTGNAVMRLTGTGQQISGNFASGVVDVTWLLTAGADYTLNGNFTTYSVQINPGATLSLSGYQLSVYTLQQYGAINLGSGTLAIAGSGSVFTTTDINTGTGTVKFISGSGVWASKPTVAQTIPSATYHHLYVATNSGYTHTLGTGGTLTVNGNLTINNPSTAGGQITTGANITIAGNWIIGESDHKGSVINLGHRVVGSAASAISFGGATTSSQINITYTHATLPAVEGFNGTALGFASAVRYTGTGTQMVFPAAYTDLVIAGTGTKALGDDISVAGNLNLNSGTLTTAVSMVMERVSVSPDVAVAYVNGGVANNNTVPTLASLAANASSMAITVPATYANYAIIGMELTVAHTYNSDLDIYLSSPAGTVYVIATDNGGNGDGYIAANFSDAGTTSYPNNSVLNGTYQPEGLTFSSLAAPITGTWTLWVVDDASGDDGTLTDFKLRLKSANTFGDIALAGNWLNSGTTFTAGNGIVTLSGGSAQAVSSNGQSFYQLVVNNPAGVVLNDVMTVTNILTLTNGVVSTGANRLIVTNTSNTSISGFGPTAFVNGNLRRYIGYNTQAYVFPVGNGTATANYHPAELQNNLLLGVSYIDAKFKALANHNDAQLNVTEGGLEVTRINSAGVWELEPNAQPTLGSYGVKLYTTGFNGLVDNEFVILKRPVGSTSGADWSTGNGLLNLVNGLGRVVADGFAFRSGLTSFSEFGIGDGSSGGSSLPIELVEFTAKANAEGRVDLAWITAIEIENDFFEVERSEDGQEFGPIAKVAGAGNSTLQHRYGAVDFQPLEGINYYRLKQVDFDGTTTYSPIKSVVFARQMAKTEWEVYPNPSNGQFTVEVSGLGSSASFYIVDMQGRVLYQSTWDAQDENMHQNLDLRDLLSPGIYKMVLVQGEGSTSKTIVIQ